MAAAFLINRQQRAFVAGVFGIRDDTQSRSVPRQRCRCRIRRSADCSSSSSIRHRAVLQHQPAGRQSASVFEIDDILAIVIVSGRFDMQGIFETMSARDEQWVVNNLKEMNLPIHAWKPRRNG